MNQKQSPRDEHSPECTPTNCDISGDEMADRTIEDCKPKFDLPISLQNLTSDGGQATTRIVFQMLMDSAHINSKSKGFWEEKPSLAEKIALIHSEVSELLEAYRKDPLADCGKKFPIENPERSNLVFRGGKFYDSDLRGMPEVEGESIGLCLEEEEMADIIIRVLDLAGHRGIDLGRAVLVKMQYNSTRPHKHGKKF